MRILLIEDEEKTAAAVKKGLSEAGYEVEHASRGDEGLAMARSETYDLLVLDIMLPRRDGWEILAELRHSGRRLPVLCLTARDAVEDRVRGLELGADDYLVKPFAFAELLARIRTVLRRGAATEPTRLRMADLEVDLIRQSATRRGRVLDLTPREFALLSLLARHGGEPLTREAIAAEVWGMPIQPDSKALDVAVRRLRVKVDEPFDTPLIHTVRGVGYVLQEQAP